MTRFISLLVFLFIIVLMTAFVSRNAQPVSIDLFLYQVNLPLAVFLLASLLLGVILGFLFNIMVVFSQKKKYRQLKKKKQVLQGLTGVLSEKDE